MLFSPKRLIVHLEWDSKKNVVFFTGCSGKTDSRYSRLKQGKHFQIIMFIIHFWKIKSFMLCNDNS